MTNHTENPAAHRTHRSEIDQRAINLTGHLLLAVVWLECRIASLPEQFGALVEAAWCKGVTAPLSARAMAEQPALSGTNGPYT
jgi:hypothetical protein